MSTTHRAALAAAALLAVGALAAPGVTGSASAAVPERAAASTPRCHNADLSASYRGGDAATSHVYGRIVLTNVSDHACRTGGYGGLSYVGDGDGTQIGAAADRDPATPVRTIVLRPGEQVLSKVAETSAAPYPRRTCRPRAVDGFRVYIPNATRSQFIAHPTTGCRNDAVHLISHQAYRRP